MQCQLRSPSATVGKPLARTVITPLYPRQINAVKRLCSASKTGLNTCSALVLQSAPAQEHETAPSDNFPPNRRANSRALKSAAHQHMPCAKVQKAPPRQMSSTEQTGHACSCTHSHSTLPHNEAGPHQSRRSLVKRCLLTNADEALADPYQSP